MSARASALARATVRPIAAGPGHRISVCGWAHTHRRITPVPRTTVPTQAPEHGSPAPGSELNLANTVHGSCDRRPGEMSPTYGCIDRQNPPSDRLPMTGHRAVVDLRRTQIEIMPGICPWPVGPPP